MLCVSSKHFVSLLVGVQENLAGKKEKFSINWGESEKNLMNRRYDRGDVKGVAKT